MKSTLHCRILYSTIVVLIVSLLVSFFSMPSKSMALGKIQYKVVFSSMGTSELQKILDNYSSQGWELAAVEQTMGQGHLIFKK